MITYIIKIDKMRENVTHQLEDSRGLSRGERMGTSGALATFKSKKLAANVMYAESSDGR